MSHTTDTNWYSIIEDLPTSGTYQMIIWCNVSDGTATKNDTIWFTTDVTPPSIKVDVPLNTTYITGSIDINLTTLV
jgi:hypothetical protein